MMKAISISRRLGFGDFYGGGSVKICAADGCENIVDRKRSFAIYCSKTCSQRECGRRWSSANWEHRLDKQRTWRRRKREVEQSLYVPRICAAEECSKPVLRGKRFARYCSYECKNRESNRQSKSRRRARLAGCEISEKPVLRFEIYADHGGKCHICGKCVSRTDFHLDHLVPIARGGEHSAVNLAPAHPKCNLSRGAGRLPAQLKLVA